MKVVRHKITGRLVYREDPDFKEGMGIANAVFWAYGINIPANEDELEEIEVTEQEWEAELLLRQGENLPYSEHIGKLKAVNPSLAKPATITRRFMGQNYDVNCLVTQSVKDLFQAGNIQIGDYVLVSFIEEIPGTKEKLIAIVTDKVYKSW